MVSRNVTTLNELQDRLANSPPEDSLQIFADVVREDADFVHAASLPHGGIHHGRDSLKEIQRLINAEWDLKVSIEQMWDIPADDMVVLYMVMEWTSHATGRTVRMPAMNAIRFKDGRIARAEVLPKDTSAILSTLDAQLARGHRSG